MSMVSTKKVYGYLVNDYGQTVLALGDSGSRKRLCVQYPRLVDRLNSLYFQAYDSHGRAVDEAVELIRSAGITDSELTRGLLQASAFGFHLSDTFVTVG